MARGTYAPPPPGAPPAVVAPTPAGAPPGLPPPGAPPAATPSGNGLSYDANGNIVDATGKILVPASLARATGITPDKFRPGDGSDFLGNLVTKNNPIAGAIRAGGDIINGQYGKAAGDFTQGATYGTLPVGGAAVPDATKAVGKLPGDAGTAVGDAATAVGNAIGGVAGGGGTSAPTPAADPGADFRQQQLDYANQLQATINGTAGPSAADIQGHSSQDRAIAQQFAAAQGATGANSGMAYRQALQNAAGISQQAGADAATLRAKEIADAQSQLGGALNAGRTSDLAKYGTDVGAGNVRYAADKDFEGKKIAAATGAASGVIGGILSDERKKTAIAPGDDEIAAMLDKLKAHKFQYKDPAEAGAAPGKRAGVMAQDLEKSMAGKALVLEAPDGSKGIDSPQAVGAMLAALASLHARTKRLEGRG